MSGIKTIESEYPEIAKEWNYTRNGSLTPEMVSPMSHKKVWWICQYGHEWPAYIYNRTKGSNCPYCSGRIPIIGINDLKTLFPIISKEWHPTKNGNLTPEMVTPKSNKTVWWLGKCGHEWPASPNQRTSKQSGCPFCSNKRVLSGFNDLQTICPNLAKEWHPTKNGKLTPDQVLSGSGKKVWWICQYGHEWPAVIASRKSGTGCPICDQSNKTSFPEQAIFFYISKVFPDSTNRDCSILDCSMELDIFIPSLHIGIEYDGSYWHNLSTKAKEKKKYNRCKEKNIRLIRIKEKPNQIIDDDCDYCISIDHAPTDSNIDLTIKKVFSYLNIDNCLDIDCKKDSTAIMSYYAKKRHDNSLLTNNPTLASEWHPTRNHSLTPDMFSCNSGKSVWWLGKCGHEWQATIARRNRGSGCPYCTGQYRIAGKNDLLTLFPEIASEWHPTKNNNLLPQDVGPNSNIKVWWLGKCGHEWDAVISNRTAKGDNCPYCTNHKVLAGFNDLKTTNPSLASEWHPYLNQNLTPEMILEKSNKKVWWLGKCGHEWSATVNNRSSGNGCPYCSNKKVLSGFNDLATINPQLALEWHPTKNKELTPQMVTVNSGKKVWWLGICGHEWESRISHRNHGAGCPICQKQKRNKPTIRL